MSLYVTDYNTKKYLFCQLKNTIFSNKYPLSILLDIINLLLYSKLLHNFIKINHD
jgi:hypothetical protein